MKRVSLIVIIGAILFGFSGCMNAGEDLATASAAEHVFSVTAGDEVIDSKLISSGESNDKDSLFKFAFGNNGVSGINYIKIGQEIILDFGSVAPDTVSAEDIFLNENGGQLYTDKETAAVTLTSDGQKWEFILEQSIVSLLSSKFPEGRFDIRGFKVTADWGTETCTYAFVIKTDPDYTPEATK